MDRTRNSIFVIREMTSREIKRKYARKIFGNYMECFESTFDHDCYVLDLFLYVQANHREFPTLLSDGKSVLGIV